MNSAKKENQSINQTSIAPISPAKPGSVARQPNQCSTAKSREQKMGRAISINQIYTTAHVQV